METLTKENFWDEMEQKYPKAMAHFKGWIDKYKEENDWDGIFSAGLPLPIPCEDEETEAPKYHELPIAMQFGIFLEYWNYWCNSQTPCRILIPGKDDRLQSYSFFEGSRTYIIAALLFIERAPV